MDQFNKLYNILMEHLNSAILAPTHGSTGGALKMTDIYATDNLQRPKVIGQYTRKGKFQTGKSKKRK
jgi:hypothetical protein